MKRPGREERQRWADMAEELAGLGYWRLDLATQALSWSSNMFRIFGLEPGIEPPVDGAVERLHPDDREQTVAVLDAAIAGTPGEPRTRIVWPDGTVRHTEGRVCCERGEDGAIIAIFGVVMDLTERRIAEAAHAARQAHLDLLADNGGDLIVEFGVDRTIRYVSSAIRRYGYDPAALVGLPAATLVHPDDVERVRALALETLSGGGVVPGRDRTYRILTADGGHVWMEGSPTLIHGADGQLTGVISVLRDITERRGASQALAAQEAQLRLISEHTRDVVFQYGLDRRILYISPAVRGYGYEPEELVGMLASDLTHPDDEPKIQSIVAELFADGPVDPDRDRSYRVRTKAGDYVWMEGRPVLVRDAEGRPASVVSLLHDVTARRAADQALAASEQRYRLLADNVSDIVSRADMKARFSYLSPSVVDITGFALEELVGHSLLPHVHPDDIDRALAYWRSAMNGTRPAGETLTYRFRHKSGEHIWLESNPTVVFDEAGAPREFVDVTRDVTARRRIEEELRRARDAAEEAAAVKSSFVANMSHEIRTPLTAVLGFSALISARTDLDPIAREHADRISAAGRSLLALVNDVLDFSKLEAGRMEIKPRPVAPNVMAREALDLFSLQAEAKGLELFLDLDPALPACLALDPQAIGQVLINLLGNAVKFSETGAVRLGLAYDAAAQSLRVAVRDSGAGLSADQAARLFQRFSQVDGSSTRRHGGTGLGLAISKGLVEAMGGEIAVDSTPGEGSTFHFAIPAPPAEPARPAAVEDEGFIDLDGVRVLVVDDNPINRELVGALLKPLGVEVCQAVDGMNGLELCAAQPFDVILLDIRMPGLDGPAVLARLRAKEGPNQQAPVLAFSADLEAGAGGFEGFDGHVAKPLDPAALYAELAHWTSPEALAEAHHANAV